MVAVACVFLVLPVLFLLDNVGHGTNDPCIDEKIDAYRRTTPTSPPRSDARFRAAASSSTCPVQEVVEVRLEEVKGVLEVAEEEAAEEVRTSSSKSSSSSFLLRVFSRLSLLPKKVPSAKVVAWEEDYPIQSTTTTTTTPTTIETTTARVSLGVLALVVE